MDTSSLKRVSEFEWHIEPTGNMRVPGILYASEDLIRAMDDKVREQVTNVATLPGIIKASYAMPDAHWGYGFPIGGVAAFDPDARNGSPVLLAQSSPTIPGGGSRYMRQAVLNRAA